MKSLFTEIINRIICGNIGIVYHLYTMNCCCLRLSTHDDDDGVAFVAVVVVACAADG